MFSIPAFVDFDKTALLAWCDQVQAIRDAVTPIEDDDPRLEELRSSWRLGRIVDNFDPDVRADAYFEAFAELPPMPVAAPAWAKATELDQSDWPIMSVTWSSNSSESGIFVTQTLALYAADTSDESGHHSAGDVVYNEPPKVDVSAIDNLLDLADARSVATRIMAAVSKVVA